MESERGVIGGWQRRLGSQLGADTRSSSNRGKHQTNLKPLEPLLLKSERAHKHAVLLGEDIIRRPLWLVGATKPSRQPTKQSKIEPKGCHKRPGWNPDRRKDPYEKTKNLRQDKELRFGVLFAKSVRTPCQKRSCKIRKNTTNKTKSMPQLINNTYQNRGRKGAKSDPNGPQRTSK